MKTARLRDICVLNPRRPPLVRAADAPTTFVSMPSVNGDFGVVDAAEIRPFAEVAKGYTYFEKGDVLFAKITPCMQNGSTLLQVIS